MSKVVIYEGEMYIWRGLIPEGTVLYPYDVVDHDGVRTFLRSGDYRYFHKSGWEEPTPIEKREESLEQRQMRLDYKEKSLEKREKSLKKQEKSLEKRKSIGEVKFSDGYYHH